MYILGISAFYHDAAAALLRDGLIVAAAEEERFSRKKHDYSFPINAINYCMKEAGIGPEQLDYVGFYEKPFIKFERILSTFLSTFPRSLPSFLKALPLWLNQKLWIPSLIKKELGYKGQILFIEHHLSHAASAFLVSPFEEAAILTLDGVGEWATTTFGLGKGKDVWLTHELHFPHSLGLLYSAFTAFLGFEVNEGEYKVMGLAPYGKPRYVDRVRKLIEVFKDGSCRLDMSYLAYHYKLENLNKKFSKLFGPPRRPESEMTEYYADIAASIQQVTEEVILKMATSLYERTGQKNLCMAGGVALNCCANGRVLREGPFEGIFIQPAAGDSGGSLGVAAYIYHTLLGHERTYCMKSASLGPSFTRDEIKEFLLQRGLQFKELTTEEELVKRAAIAIASDKVVGWFQGRMEFGPRALGNRSILANPCNPQMKDIINAKIKHREPFRPFAPSALEEKAREYFQIDCPAPFMLLIAKVREEKRHLLPAITHVDGTARLQTVNRQESPLYHRLISEVEELTGVPVVLNTSFNVRGEPIVCSPEEAWNTFMKTDIDLLFMGNFIISKDGQI